jgi:hypothetical protein
MKGMFVFAVFTIRNSYPIIPEVFFEQMVDVLHIIEGIIEFSVFIIVNGRSFGKKTDWFVIQQSVSDTQGKRMNVEQ